MKLWLISQGENNRYDTYDSAVVAAETEDEARLIHPAGPDRWGRLNPEKTKIEWWETGGWCGSPEKVEVELIGKATPGTERGVILASYNAG